MRIRSSFASQPWASSVICLGDYQMPPSARGGTAGFWTRAGQGQKDTCVSEKEWGMPCKEWLCLALASGQVCPGLPWCSWEESPSVTVAWVKLGLRLNF